MLDINQYNSSIAPTWCPGCGNFGIIAALKMALAKQELTSDDVCVTYDVGCSSNMAGFMNTYGIGGLHGRSIITASGVSMANHNFPIVAIGGDGGLFGEGVEHFLTAIRQNVNMTVLIHNNNLYSLTTGQRSPLTRKGFVTKSTPFGNVEIPLRPLEMAVLHEATFVARGFSSDVAQLTELIEMAMKHKGFSIVEALQPCPTFNKDITMEWLKERVYKLENNEGLSKEEAMKVLADTEKLATGVIYVNNERKTYDEENPQMATPILEDDITQINIGELMKEFR